MEFYTEGLDSATKEGCFNSQRDGILPLSFCFCSIGSDRFNSQRDGILLTISGTAALIFTWFQFPTGWNSTLLRPNRHCLCGVSIPNGMEFYSSDPLIKKLLFGFNSQRDGILLCVWVWRAGREEFQFPTGWNSTIIEYVSHILNRSFNSQRDGILRRLYSPNELQSKFQFPTGWNSTVWRKKRSCSFTRFNSQRDGILQA